MLINFGPLSVMRFMKSVENPYLEACVLLDVKLFSRPSIVRSSSVHSRTITAVNNQRPIKFGSASGRMDEFLSRVYLASLIGGYSSLVVCDCEVRSNGISELKLALVFCVGTVLGFLTQILPNGA